MWRKIGVSRKYQIDSWEVSLKIVCTMGPESKSEGTLQRMIDIGLDVARITLSHENHSFAKKTFDMIQRIDENEVIF